VDRTVVELKDVNNMMYGKNNDPITGKKLGKQAVAGPKNVKVSEKTMNDIAASSNKKMEARDRAAAKQKQKEEMSKFIKTGVGMFTGAIIAGQTLANYNKEKKRQK
jgi:hypothetical protein